jgi:hypothetical protein
MGYVAILTADTALCGRFSSNATNESASNKHQIRY